jgi:predicted molibdopterin-dependent oxidoreductase YjgC
MFEITVNNRVIDAEPGETILSALTRVGIKVPTLCHMKDLLPSGACRICVVEVEGNARTRPICSFPGSGRNEAIHEFPMAIAQEKSLSNFAANHPMTASTASGRRLQAQALARIRSQGNVITSHARRGSVDLTSPSIVRDQASCILCGKMHKTCEEIQKISQSSSSAEAEDNRRSGISQASTIELHQLRTVLSHARQAPQGEKLSSGSRRTRSTTKQDSCHPACSRRIRTLARNSA